SSGSGVFNPSKNRSSKAPTPPPIRNHWIVPTAYVRTRVQTSNPGGLIPARSNPENTIMMTSIGATSKIVINRQKSEWLNRYGPNFASPGSKRTWALKSRYEKTKNPDASNTWQTADANATRFQKACALIPKASNHVSKW